MDPRNAYILFKGERAGTLSETPAGGTSFAYDANWPTSIACAFPRSEGEHHWPVGLHPFFEHLTAEGWLRGVQARAGHVQQQDDFGLLLTFGVDCIGAVGVEPIDLRQAVIRQPGADAENAVVAGRRSVSGVQKKLLAFHDGERFRPSERLDQNATHIAKFNSEKEPTLVRNEDLSLRLAREILGEREVTDAAIGTVAGIDGVALLVERFDREDETKLRLEDFAQILGKPRDRDFKGKYRSSYEEAASAVRAFSARPVVDLDRFFRRLIFSFLIGDADGHLKNFSLLERREGLRLSPAYDQLNTSIYEDYDRDTALEIDGKVRSLDTIDRAVLIALGQQIGLARAAIDRAIAETAAAWGRATTLRIGPDIDPQDFRTRYLEIVSNNALRLFS